MKLSGKTFKQMTERSFNNFLSDGKQADRPTHGSLFSGIGGFDLAAEWMGWDNIFHCEWNTFGQQILQHYWPNAITYEDITKTNFSIHRGEIDILTGGFPCQPYSIAGKREGKEDERHLWPEMLRAIKEIAPSYVVAENVYGLVNWNDGVVFNEVQTDLENEGYEVQPYILPAASVNAPHKRDRVWFIAYSYNNRKSRRTRENESESKKERLQERNQVQQLILANSLRELSANSSCERCDNRRDNRKERQICENQNRNAQEDKPKGNGRKCGISKVREIRNVTNTKSESCGREHEQRQEQGEFRGCDCKNDATYTECQRGREILQNIQPEKPNGFSSHSFNEPNDWEDFPTQPPICDGDDGLSSRLDAPTVFKRIEKPRKPITFAKWRMESVKGGGNAIVPQIALNIFRTIRALEEKIRQNKTSN